MFQPLLDHLCTELGLCLAPAEQVRLLASPPATVQAFAKAVLVAEGLDPELADKRLLRRVEELASEHFGRRESARSAAIVRLVEALVAGDYDRVMRLAPRSNVTAEELRQEIERSGCSLSPLPVHAVPLIDYVLVVQALPPTWSVVVPLFTEKSGPSDLSLELTMVEHGLGQHEIQIDGLHAL